MQDITLEMLHIIDTASFRHGILLYTAITIANDVGFNVGHLGGLEERLAPPGNAKACLHASSFCDLNELHF